MADGQEKERKVAFFSTTPKDNELRIGVKCNLPGYDLPQMKILDQTRPLNEVINECCAHWKLENASDFSFQFDDDKSTPPPIFINEQNRDSIKMGDILKLDFSPQRSAKDIVSSFTTGNISFDDLKKLSFLTIDRSFCDEFVSRNDGMAHLYKHLARERNGSMQLTIRKHMIRHGGRIGCSLQSFLNIMEAGQLPWDSVQRPLLDSVMWLLSDTTASIDATAVSCSLDILNSVISESDNGKRWIVDLDLTVDSFIEHLKKRDAGIQIKCICLLNTIFENSDREKQKSMKKQILSSRTRQLINESLFKDKIGDEMSYQLYKLQTHLFNLLQSTIERSIKLNDEAAMRTIQQLKKSAFESEPDASPSGGASPRRITTSRDFIKLGFTNSEKPLEDFAAAPPGALTLDSLSYFSDCHQSAFRDMVLENSRERAEEADCPIVRASVELTQLLIDILHITGKPVDVGLMGTEGRTFYPLFFTKEKPFAELFSLCIQRFTKTWREMKASLDDFPKVVMVVREQIKRALNVDISHGEAHIKLTQFDQLKRKLNQLSFAEIQKIRHREQEQEEELRTQAKPIRDLRESLRDEMMDIIRQQRLNSMLKGQMFKYTKGKGGNKEKNIFCKLSPNLKTLQYGFSPEPESIPQLNKSINLLDVLDITEDATRHSISLRLPDNDDLLLICQSGDIRDIWLDGLNHLSGKKMTSKLTTKDVDTLLSLDVKLRLLEAEGVIFPDTPPPIPAPPPNLNFATA